MDQRSTVKYHRNPSHDCSEASHFNTTAKTSGYLIVFRNRPFIITNKKPHTKRSHKYQQYQGPVRAALVSVEPCAVVFPWCRRPAVTLSGTAPPHQPLPAALAGHRWRPLNRGVPRPHTPPTRPRPPPQTRRRTARAVREMSAHQRTRSNSQHAANKS